MYKQIFKQIKKFDNIVIARHISVDPDAMASQIGLRDSIRLTFPQKNVYAIGTGTVRFNYMGKLDHNIDYSKIENFLLIVVDTPDKRRIDMDELKDNYSYSIKIDHHPFIEKVCDMELIKDTKSSASEIICELIKNTPLKMNKQIAETIYCGIVSDTNRFMFNNSNSETFENVAYLLSKYKIDIIKCYNNLYRRPLEEVKLLGYMAQNMKITDNGVGYIKVTNEVLNKYNLDSASSGNLINEFNHIEDVLVWLSATEDVKNSHIRISIRSRGPVINKIAEKYNGGGHKLASGARITSFEEVDLLVKDLDNVCKRYIESSDDDENY